MGVILTTYWTGMILHRHRWRPPDVILEEKLSKNPMKIGFDVGIQLDFSGFSSNMIIPCKCATTIPLGPFKRWQLAIGWWFIWTDGPHSAHLLRYNDRKFDIGTEDDGSWKRKKTFKYGSLGYPWYIAAWNPACLMGMLISWTTG